MKKLTLSFLLSICISLAFADSAFNTKIEQLGFITETLSDMSSDKSITFDKPDCAYINITGIDNMPETKTADYHAMFEVYDGNGHYFKKKVIINAQGKSSMSFPKKNLAIDFCEDDWIGSETTDITIGDWVTQDAFHFKAYYTNFFRGEAIVGFELFNQIENLHSEESNKAWKRAGISNVGNARCYPDGFPCVIYLNGEFYGVYAWSLKKHRKNMAQTKDNPNHIHLDGVLADSCIWRGKILWDKFEIRNPKTLYCVNTDILQGYAYEALSYAAEIAEVQQSGNYEVCTDKPSDWSNENISQQYGTTPPAYLYRQKKDKWYKLIQLSGTTYAKYDGDNPTELIDETMPYYDSSNSDMVNTAKVKSALLKLSKYHSELLSLEKSGATAEEIREAFKTRYDITSILDYYCLCTMIGNCDGFSKNWQWFTYDGNKWFVAPYDLDVAFGNQSYGYLITDAYYTSAYGVNYKMKFSTGPFYWIQRYFLEDAAEVWRCVYNAGISTPENICGLMASWKNKVGDDNYSQEWVKWPDTYCINDLVISPNWTLQETPAGYYTLPEYNKNATYNEGDRCTAAHRVWIANTTIKGVTPYVKLGCRDSWERFSSWVDKRIELENGYWNDLQTSYYDLVVPKMGYTTVCVPFKFDIPSGMLLYTLTEFDKLSLRLLSKTKITDPIAYKPYQVKATPGTYRIFGVVESVDPTSEDYLKNGALTGTLENIYASIGDVIYHSSGKNSFYRVVKENENMIKANQAYFKYSTPMLTYDIEVPSGKYTTVCVPFDFDIPSGVQIYTMDEFNRTSLMPIIKNKANKGLANKPYQVKANPGTYRIIGKEEVIGNPEDEDYLKNGVFTGTLEDIQLQEGDIIFPHPTGRNIYYRVTANDNITLSAHHAYIKNETEIMSYIIEVGQKKYTTVCVPFSFDIPSGMQLYTVNSFDPETEISSKNKVTVPEANKPYQVKANPGNYTISGIVEEYDDNSEEALTNGALVGTYSDIYLEEGQWAYPHPITQSAGYYYVRTNNTILCPAYHAYVRPYQTATQQNAPSRESVILFNYDETSTSVIESEIIDAEADYYTLSGFRVNSPKQGLFIKKKGSEIQKVIIWK